MTAVVWNEDAERSLLGAVFLGGGGVLDRVAVEPEEFYDTRNRELWLAFCRLHARKVPIDPTTVRTELGEALAACGGHVYLSDLMAHVPTAANAEHYAGLVRHTALTRRIRADVADALSSGLEADELLGKVLEVASRLGRRQTDGSITMRDLASETMRDLGIRCDRIANGEVVQWGIPTGLSDLDYLLGGGLQFGVVTVLGGRPSMGKSSLARTFADNASVAGFGVHVFSMEDSRRSYALRALSDRSRVDLHRLRSLDIPRGDMELLYTAANDLYQRRNWRIDDIAGLSSQQIAMRVRRHRAENDTRLVIVDYVQLMRERGARDKRAEVERAAEGMVELARAENVALVLLSQLNRESERRGDNRAPQLSDLRESGALEQVADAVAFVYRADMERDQGEVLVKKNKHGPLGKVDALWDGRTATYRPLERHRQT